MTTKELKKRDAKRDLGAGLLESVQQMKARRAGKIHKITVSPVVSPNEIRLVSIRLCEAARRFRAHPARLGTGPTRTQRRGQDAHRYR